VPVSAWMMRRSPSASPPQAYTQPIRIGMPISVTASPTPTAIPVTRKTNSSVPRQPARSR
jgi:hypothetical protein